MENSQNREKKICENRGVLPVKNTIRNRVPEVLVYIVLSGLFYGGNSDKESSPVVGKFLYSWV